MVPAIAAALDGHDNPAAAAPTSSGGSTGAINSTHAAMYTAGWLWSAREWDSFANIQYSMAYYANLCKKSLPPAKTYPTNDAGKQVITDIKDTPKERCVICKGGYGLAARRNDGAGQCYLYRTVPRTICYNLDGTKFNPSSKEFRCTKIVQSQNIFSADDEVNATTKAHFQSVSGPKLDGASYVVATCNVWKQATVAHHVRVPLDRL